MKMMTGDQQYTIAASSPDKMFINGVSSEEVGLYVDTPPMPPMPEERVEYTGTPYANGDLYGRTGMYNDITITVKCFVFDGGYHPQKIYGFISGAKTLAFSRTMQYHYKVKKVLGIIPQYRQAGKNILAVQFICAPFRYETQNNPVQLTENPSYVVNATNIYHEPVFRVIFGEDALFGRFTVNDITLQLQAMPIQSSTIIIDTGRKKIYKESAGGTLTIIQQYTTGDFWKMILPPGKNTISWQGEVESVIMTQNARWL